MSWGGIGAYVRAWYDPVWVVAEDSRRVPGHEPSESSPRRGSHEP